MLKRSANSREYSKYQNNFVAKMLTSIMPDTAPNDYASWTIESDNTPKSFMLLV